MIDEIIMFNGKKAFKHLKVLAEEIGPRDSGSEMERKAAAPYTFEEVRQQLIERLQQSKSVEAYVEKLREKTYVDIRFKGWTPDVGGN